jgi:hypothetical protein
MYLSLLQALLYELLGLSLAGGEGRKEGSRAFELDGYRASLWLVVVRGRSLRLQI